jgi:hypothetical protein
VSDADVAVEHSWRDAASLGFGLAVFAWAFALATVHAVRVPGEALLDRVPVVAWQVGSLGSLGAFAVVADRLYAAGYDVKGEVGDSLVVAIPAYAVVAGTLGALTASPAAPAVGVFVAASLGLAVGFRNRIRDADLLGWA